MERKEAIEIVRGFLNPNASDALSDALRTLIPELKESEDERIRKTLIDLIKGITSWNYFLGISREQMIAWLEKQGNEQKQTWSEEDEYQINTIFCYLCFKREVYKKEGNKVEEDRYNTQYNWLKSFKDRVGCEVNCTTTKEWSEEDEYQINTILHGLNLKKEIYKKRGNKVEEERYNTQYNWLKFCKDKYKNAVEYDKTCLEKQGEQKSYRGNADTMRKNLIKAFKSVGSNHWGGFNVRDIIHFLESKDAIELEKQGNEIIPVEDIIHIVWELGNLWQELTNGVCTTEHGRKIDYIVKHWKEGEHYIKSFEKQCEQKPIEKVEPKFKVGDRVLWKYDKSDVYIIARVSDCGTYWIEHPGCGSGWWSEKELEPYADKDEQKSAIGPKFKVGDWIICDGLHPALILNIDKNKYEIEFTDNGVKGFHPIDFIERHYHLWTIEDAKDGDVLASHECYVIFKEIEGLNIRCHCTYHYIGYNPSFYEETLQNKTAFHPATKEQRDLLFKEMGKSGYKWDVNRKKMVSVLKLE